MINNAAIKIDEPTDLAYPAAITLLNIVTTVKGHVIAAGSDSELPPVAYGLTPLGEVASKPLSRQEGGPEDQWKCAGQVQYQVQIFENEPKPRRAPRIAKIDIDRIRRYASLKLIRGKEDITEWLRRCPKAERGAAAFYIDIASFLKPGDYVGVLTKPQPYFEVKKQGKIIRLRRQTPKLEYTCCLLRGNQCYIWYGYEKQVAVMLTPKLSLHGNRASILRARSANFQNFYDE